MREYEWRPAVHTSHGVTETDQWYALGREPHAAAAQAIADENVREGVQHYLRDLLPLAGIKLIAEVREVLDPEVEAVAHVISPDTMPGEWSRSKARAAIAALDEIRGESKPAVVIEPREGMTPYVISTWLESNFQSPGAYDDTTPYNQAIHGGDPLVNAKITVRGGRS